MKQSNQTDKFILIGGDKEDTKEFFNSHLDVKVVSKQEAQNNPCRIGWYIEDIRVTLDLKTLEFDKSLIEQVISYKPEHKDWPL